MENTQSGLSSVIGYVPPKMWKDLSVEEKLERIREQIKFLQRDIPSLRIQIDGINNDLKNHDHLNGKVLKDIKTQTGGFLGANKICNPEAETKGEVYF